MSDIIRPFQAKDLPMVRLLIGTSTMSPLAWANMRACAHPATIAIWLGMTSIMIQLLDWWPTTTGPGGYLGLLYPLPALGATAVPVMFFFDWIHRPVFEENLKEALVGDDMIDPQGHYARSPASGFYVLEHDSKIIGLIALDASPKSVDAPSARTRSSKAEAKRKSSAETAVIRHFHVEEMYHPSGVQEDLLKHALTRAFASPTGPKRVIAVGSTLEKYKLKALRKAGFGPASNVRDFGQPGRKVGIHGWKPFWLEMNVEAWRARQ